MPQGSVRLPLASLFSITIKADKFVFIFSRISCSKKLTIKSPHQAGYSLKQDYDLFLHLNQPRPVIVRPNNIRVVGSETEQVGWFGPPQVSKVILPMVDEIAALANASATVP